MAFNGSGTFNRNNGFNTGTTVWADDDGAGVAIVTGRHDTHDQDLANGLTNCVTKDGQTTPTANIPMGGFLHTNVGDATARTHYLAAGQLQDGETIWGGTSGGSANAQTVSTTPTITALVTGMTIRFKAGFTSTAALTLTVGSTAATAVEDMTGDALTGGEVRVNGLYEVIYDGTTWILLSGQPALQTWSPTYGAGGSMTYTSVTTNQAQFWELGNIVSFVIDASGTTGGTASSFITFSAPTNIGGSGSVFSVNGWLQDGGNSIDGHGFKSSNNFTAKRYDSANWSLGASRDIHFAGWYEAA